MGTCDKGCSHRRYNNGLDVFGEEEEEDGGVQGVRRDKIDKPMYIIWCMRTYIQ